MTVLLKQIISILQSNLLLYTTEMWEHSDDPTGWKQTSCLVKLIWKTKQTLSIFDTQPTSSITLMLGKWVPLMGRTNHPLQSLPVQSHAHLGNYNHVFVIGEFINIYAAVWCLCWCVLHNASRFFSLNDCSWCLLHLELLVSGSEVSECLCCYIF